MQSDDPTDVRVIVVRVDDVVTALEANVRADEAAVLRITPPFAGRMRARLHVADREGRYGDPAPVHVDPATLVADAPDFPDPDVTEDELRADPDAEYTPDRHRERHAAAVASWREAVGERIRDRATLDTDAGPHEVAVRTLK